MQDPRFKRYMKEFAQRFDLDSLDNLTDIKNLEMLITNYIIMEDLQLEISNLSSDNIVEHITTIGKLTETYKTLSETSKKIETSLALDRKTRKNSNEQNSMSEYMRVLKENVGEFLEERFLKVYCPTCQIMVGRIIPVYHHTAYICNFGCPQCEKMVKVTREGKDITYDLEDWRKEHKIEIRHPKEAKTTSLDDIDSDDDEIIE